MIKNMDKLFKCEECGKSFYSAGILKIHLLTQSGEKLKCSQCEQRFKLGGNMDHRKKSQHFSTEGRC